MPLNEDSDIGAKIWLRRLRSRTAKAGKTSIQKVNLRFLNLHRDYSNSLILSGKKYAHSFGIEFLPALLKFKKKKCDARAKLFFCLLNLLFFWSSCCRIAVLPIVYPRTHARSLHCIPSTSFHCVYSMNEYGETSMEPKFSSLKLSADIPPKTFFGKLSTLENIVTGDEGKKSSDQKKIIQQKTHKKSKFRYRKQKNSNI